MTGIAPSPARTSSAHPAAPPLEALLGDPFDGGTLAFETIVDQEEASRLTPAVRAACDAGGVGAELVPAELGGRRTTSARLVSQLRPLFRRDLSLAVDLVAAPLAVMNAALAAGRASQRAEVARLIGSGAQLGAVLADPGWPASTRGIRVSPARPEWTAEGETPLVAGAAGGLWALPARAPGAAEAVVLCDVGRSEVDVAPWVETVGLRGTRFGVATVRAMPVGDAEVLHADGSPALERARGETAAIVAALAIGTLETAVHLAVPYACGRRLYRGTVLDIPHARSLLADVHTDLLIADALAQSVLRRRDVDGFDEVAASALAYLVPHLLTEAMRTLSVLFGSTFYARVEPYAVFEAWVRDLGSLSLLGIGTPRVLEPVAASLGSWADAAPLVDVPFAHRRAGFAARVRGAEPGDAAETRSLAREAAIFVAADACADMHRTGAAPATDEWLAAAQVRLSTRLTGRKASLSDTSIESAVADVTACVESGRSVTFERVPVFGR